MKKLLFLFSAFLFFQNINATHNLGGDITLKQLDHKLYEVNLTTYYVFSSPVPADRDSLMLCWGDGICEWIARDSAYLIDCHFRYNLFRHTHLYAEEGEYIVSMTDPNRNGGILNINPPSSDNVPFHVQTKHTVSSAWNNTPLLLNPPTDQGQVGEIFQHNPSAVDLEGDSLVYALITPMQAVNENVPNYVFPNEISPSSNNNITIHPEFGTLHWECPMQAGRYTVAISIREFRNGQFLSETIRDLQLSIGSGFIGNPETNTPQLDVPFNIVELSLGETFNFVVDGSDENGEEVLFQIFGLPFLIDDPAQFSLAEIYLPTPQQGTFSWTITNAHLLLEPYFVVFRIEDDPTEDCGLTKYQVLKIKINDTPVGLKEKEQLVFKIFPNPVLESQLNIQIPTDEISQQSFYKIKNASGQVLKKGIFENHSTLQPVDIQGLANGFYFITIGSGKKIGSSSFIISR